MDTSLSTDPGFLKPTLKYTVEVWWAWLWRASLLGFVGACCAVVLIAVILIAAHVHIPAPVPAPRPSPDLRLIMSVPIFLVGLVAQVWAFQLVLKKTFKKFSVRLVKSPCG
jgi:hypothetical protein